MAWLAAAADSRGQCQDQHVLLLLSFYLLLPCRTVLWAHVCVLISESVRANCTENYFTEGYYRRNSPSIFPALFFFLKRIERNSFKCILCCDACWNLKKQFLLIETFIPISQHLNLDKWKKMLFFFFLLSLLCLQQPHSAQFATGTFILPCLVCFLIFFFSLRKQSDQEQEKTKE